MSSRDPRSAVNLGCLAVAIGAALPGAAPAQSDGGLEEVVVTAQRREESLQDTTISLVAMDAVELEKLGITDIGDLGSNVPNLQQTPHPNSATTPRVFIRGVGNYDDQITQDPSVAVYMDGIYVARNQGMGAEVADLERIEILRGPQGTLYGRNATGGAINFVTLPPELDTWLFTGEFSAGNREALGGRAMLNIPLGDTAAARIAYLKTKRDGFVRNAGTGEGTFGAEDRDALRADFRWAPSDALDLRYAYDRSEIGDTPFYLQYSPAGVPPSRPNISDPSVQNLQANDITVSGHQLIATWEVTDQLTFKSLTGYRDVDSFVYQDYLSGRFGPLAALIIESDVDQDQFSQEFQLLGSALEDRLQYIAGLYYFTESGDGSTANVLPATGIVASTAVDIDNEAYAAYLQGTYTPRVLDDRLHVTVGGRWSNDAREATLANSTRLANGTVIPGSAGAADRDFEHFSPSLTVAFDAADSVNVYASVVDGYKTGGFNVRASSIQSFEEGFDEETLLSYELGLKSELLHKRLRVNAAVFYSDYDDIQINAQSDLTDPTKADILNAGKATIQGVELDVTALLLEGLTLELGYGYLDASYDEIIDGRGVDVTDLYAFVNAPKNSYRADATWEFGQTSIGRVIANVGYTWQDEKFSTASLAAGRYLIDDYGLVNARLTLADIPLVSEGSLRVALWGRNLDDEEYPFIYAPLFGGYRAWGEPRSYGVDVTYEF